MLALKKWEFLPGSSYYNDTHVITRLNTEGGSLGMNATIFYSHRRLLVILASFALGFALVACGGGKHKKKDQPAEEKGSLSRTYKLVDEQGRKSGTLTLDPMGGAELRDADGKLIKKFTPQTPAEAQAKEEPAEVQAKEEPAEPQPKEEPASQ